MNLEPTVFVVDDDIAVRDSLRLLFEAAGIAVECFADAGEYLAQLDPQRAGCLLLDLRPPGMSGLALQAELRRRGAAIPIIFLTGHGDIPLSVRAIKAGAVDFLTKPTHGAMLIEKAREAMQRDVEQKTRLRSLTEREREILQHVIAGQSSKEIARLLGISHRTVEVHRAHLMQKLDAHSALELAEITRDWNLVPQRKSG